MSIKGAEWPLLHRSQCVHCWRYAIRSFNTQVGRIGSGYFCSRKSPALFHLILLNLISSYLFDLTQSNLYHEQFYSTLLMFRFYSWRYTHYRCVHHSPRGSSWQLCALVWMQESSAHELSSSFLYLLMNLDIAQRNNKMSVYKKGSVKRSRLLTLRWSIFNLSKAQELELLIYFIKTWNNNEYTIIIFSSMRILFLSRGM